MAFSEVFDPTTPADTAPANQYAQYARNFKTDIAQRLAGMSNAAVATAEAQGWEAIFNGMLFLDTTTGKLYTVNSGGTFAEYTPLLLSNISEADTALQAQIVAAIAGIPATSPGPLALPTGVVGVTPSAGNSTTLLATTAFAQGILGEALAIPSLAANGYFKLPLTFNSSGVPQTFVIVQWGTSGNSSTGANEETVSVSFPITFPTGVFTAVAVANARVQSGTRSVVCTVESLTTSGFSLVFANTDSSSSINTAVAGRWIAIGY